MSRYPVNKSHNTHNHSTSRTHKIYAHTETPFILFFTQFFSHLFVLLFRLRAAAQHSAIHSNIIFPRQIFLFSICVLVCFFFCTFYFDIDEKREDNKQDAVNNGVWINSQSFCWLSATKSSSSQSVLLSYIFYWMLFLYHRARDSFFFKDENREKKI